MKYLEHVYWFYIVSQVETWELHIWKPMYIVLIIGIVYGVCWIVIKSVQQCNYFLFSMNLLLVGVNFRLLRTKIAIDLLFPCKQIIWPRFLRMQLTLLVTGKNE
jgi:hypothetical protein